VTAARSGVATIGRKQSSHSALTLGTYDLCTARQPLNL
jgi:hypothetical protein